MEEYLKFLLEKGLSKDIITQNKEIFTCLYNVKNPDIEVKVKKTKFGVVFMEWSKKGYRIKLEFAYKDGKFLGVLVCKRNGESHPVKYIQNPNELDFQSAFRWFEGV